MAICRCGYLSEGGTSPVAAKGFVESSLIQPFQGIQQGYAIGYDFCHGFNVTAKVDKFMSVLNLLFAGENGQLSQSCRSHRTYFELDNPREGLFYECTLVFIDRQRQRADGAADSRTLTG